MPDPIAPGRALPVEGEQPLSVGVVCPYDLGVPGGVQSHVVDMVDAMSQRGVRMQVLAPVCDQHGVARRFGQWPQWLTSAGASRPVAINGSVAPVRMAPGQRSLVRSWVHDQRLQVVHVHEPFVPALARPAVHAAAALGLPVVGTFHASVDSPALLRGGRPWLRRTLHRLAAVVAVSEMAARTARTVDPGAVVDIVPNPVDVRRFADAAVRHPTPGLTGGRVLFLGRGDEPRKGLDDLLAAWPLVLAARPHAVLTVAGRMRRSSFPVEVRAVGEVAEADKPAVLADADVFVAPHRGGESMGIVLVEAMAAGTAVVATDLPAFLDVSQGLAARHTPVADPVALAGAIIDVLGDAALRTDLQRRGSARAADFDIAAVTDEVLGVYRRFLP